MLCTIIFFNNTHLIVYFYIFHFLNLFEIIKDYFLIFWRSDDDDDDDIDLGDGY